MNAQQGNPVTIDYNDRSGRFVIFDHVNSESVRSTAQTFAEAEDIYDKTMNRLGFHDAHVLEFEWEVACRCADAAWRLESANHFCG